VEPQNIEGYFEESETSQSDPLVSGRTIPSLCIPTLKVSLSFVQTVGMGVSGRSKDTGKEEF
jgi:hypothetical protein